MFDFAWSEILVIGMVALIVIGPKDLPRVLRAAGKWIGKARAIAREFQGSIDQMIRESELDEVRREVEKATSMDEIHKTIDPKGELRDALQVPDLNATVSKPTETLAPSTGEVAPSTGEAVPGPGEPVPSVSEAVPSTGEATMMPASNGSAAMMEAAVPAPEHGAPEPTSPAATPPAPVSEPAAGPAKTPA